jgi:hypothetical protein
MKPRPRVYRSRDQAVLIALFQPLLGFVIVVVAYQPERFGPPTNGVEWFALLYAVGGTAFAWLRLARCGVTVRPDRLTVRNPLRTTTLTWDEVAEFRLERWRLWPRIAVLQRTDSTLLPVVGIQAPNPTYRPNDMSAQRLVDQLNAELAAHRVRHAASAD